jgi:hypothetical protein
MRRTTHLARVTADALPAGSPYRGAPRRRPAVAIADKGHPWAIDVGLGALALAAVVTTVLRLGLLPLWLAFWALWLGAMRWVYHRGRRGVHRIEVDERGIRLRCSDAALVQVLSVVHPRAVDLFIPWQECVSIDARAHAFGDDIEMALVITTIGDAIAVRPGVFSVDPATLADRLRAARERLALPAADE